MLLGVPVELTVRVVVGVEVLVTDEVGVALKV